jgi:hypothetical protein
MYLEFNSLPFFAIVIAANIAQLAISIRSGYMRYTTSPSFGVLLDKPLIACLADERGYCSRKL